MKRKLLSRFLAAESDEEIAKIIENLSVRNRHEFIAWRERYHRTFGRDPQIRHHVYTNENGATLVIKGIY